MSRIIRGVLTFAFCALGALIAHSDQAVVRAGDTAQEFSAAIQGLSTELAGKPLAAGWISGPEGLSASFELGVDSGAAQVGLTFDLRGELIAVPSGSPAAVALVAPRSGAVLLLRLARTSGTDGLPIPASWEIAKKRLRLVLDLDGVPLPATVVVQLTRNGEAGSRLGEVSPAAATCGMTGTLAATDDRDVFSLSDLDDSAGALVLVRGAMGQRPPRPAFANGVLRLERAPDSVNGGYEIDWMDRRRLTQPTAEGEPNDHADQANVSGNDVFVGALNTSLDRDLFRFGAGAGDRVVVMAETASRDSLKRSPLVLTVRDELGRVVAVSASDDVGFARNFEGAAVAFRAPADARYVVELAPGDETLEPVGAYTLGVSRNCAPSFLGGRAESHPGATVPTATPANALRSGKAAIATTPTVPARTDAMLAVPTEVDDSLRVSRSGSVAMVSWTAAAGTFNVYRGSRPAGASWDYNQSCLVLATSATSATDAQPPAAGELYYYLVSRQSGCEESVLGRSSAGVPTPASGLCFSPGTGFLPAKPYFMVAFDTSNSMTTAVAGANSCNLPLNRLGHGRCALRNMIQAYSGQANFGLATYAMTQAGCAGSCYFNCVYSPFPGETGPGVGCGRESNTGDSNSSTRAAANIVVPMQADDFWSASPTPSNVNQMLAWTDNVCTGDLELFAAASTPLNGVLRDMYRYFSNSWTSLAGSPTYTSPLGTAGQDRSCRSVNVILITDGDETCDTQPNAVAAAAALRTGFTKSGITWSVKTYVINFAGGSQVNTDQIASAGGTGASYLATNETQLSQALAAIIGGAALRETCDNLDNNCNGCIDEGYLRYSDVQGVPSACCSWTTAAERSTCLNTYRASITPALPRGNVALLPCTTVAQQSDPTTWLCYDPGEICDGIDNNGDGSVDEGTLTCGNPPRCPATEVCNGLDDDCDGAVDEGGVCPGGCVATQEICDGCDNDCDGLTDDGIAPLPCGRAFPANCQGILTCRTPVAVTPGGCSPSGGWDGCSNNPQSEVCDGLDNDCNGAVDDSGSCPCAQRQEVCNGIDDNCNSVVDEGVPIPSPAQVCGVSPAATSPECTTGVTVACVGGLYSCTFPAGVCTGPGGCAGTAEICDALDNNCDGRTNENVPKYGERCASDDGLPPPGHGACRTTGSYICTSATTTACSAVKADCAATPGFCKEQCDGIDNDCDGLVDESFANKGPNPTFFVKPAVAKTSNNTWEFVYEASRPSADLSSPGFGNGYFTSAPAGVPLEKTIACSAAKRVPWFTVTAAEAEQACQAIGGHVCSLAEWQSGCQASASCKWGYAPRGGACVSTYNVSKRCNLGPSWDFNPSIVGDQDGLLSVAAAGPNCWADWAGLLGNLPGANLLTDVTGNLREFAMIGANQYAVMGGAFNSGSEAGSACGFDFYQVDQNYSGFDVGFRCCFSVDPTQ